MTQTANDSAFKGSIPKTYETYLVPFIFQPYADDIARRAAALSPARVLELAAGTGVVSRALDNALPAATEIVATDLNPDMFAEARTMSMSRQMEWKQADALALPFPDNSFDVVVCQFGVMFFPDRAKGYSEARRVLRPGGTFLFNVWDSLEDNDFADDISRALTALFPHDPPRFLERAPYGYFSHNTIRADLQKAGFDNAAFDVVTVRAHATSARAAAIGYCQGIPLRAEIEARSPGGLEAATDHVTQVLERKFGRGTLVSKIQAVVVVARKTQTPAYRS